MKKILFIFLLLPLVVVCQQQCGAGQNNGYYKSLSGLVLAPADTTTVMAVADSFYILNARMTDGHNIDFTVYKDSLKYTRGDSYCFLFVGSSNGKTDKAATITYALFINDIAVTGGNTDRYFHNAGQYNGFNINLPVTLQPNDIIKVMVKSDTQNTTLTINQLNLCFVQIK